MWNFIKYCVKCMLLFIGAAFGNTPNEAKIKDYVVGGISIVVFLALTIGIRFLIYFISKKFRKKKNNFHLTEDE